MLKTVAFTFLLIVISFSAAAAQLTVAVAANVQFAMNEIETAFEKESGIDVNIVLNSSGKLTAQITNGAPYDVFLSADMKYPQSLYDGGRAIHPPQIYANGRLVLWSKKAAAVSSSWGELIAGAKHIAIADPLTAPYGKAAVEALEFFDVYAGAAPKLVFGKSISQVNQYILSGAADWGLTAKSVVLSAKLDGVGHYIDIDAKAFSPIAQGAVILKYGRDHHPQAAEAFFDFLFSETAGQIFQKYGYTLP